MRDTCTGTGPSEQRKYQRTAGTGTAQAHKSSPQPAIDGCQSLDVPLHCARGRYCVPQGTPTRRRRPTRRAILPQSFAMRIPSDGGANVARFERDQAALHERLHRWPQPPVHYQFRHDNSGLRAGANLLSMS